MEPSHHITFMIGVAASILTASSFLPQLFKILRDKKAQDLSYGMLSILFAGLALWVCYGFFINDPVIMISNSVSVAINIAMVVCMIKYKK